jgi:hypothetical protein
MTTEERMSVAKSILSQLGGHKFTVMVGAENYTVGEDGGLSFRLPQNNERRVNYVSILLDANDTYTMTFERVRRLKREPYIERKLIERRTDVYFDAMQDVFTHVTGLDTHL